MSSKARRRSRSQAKFSFAPPSLRNGRKKLTKPTRRKRLFEQLEARRVLAAFGANHIVVEQINATSNHVTPTSSSSPVFLDEFTTGGTAVQQLAMPTIASGSNQPLTLGGTAGSEGGLSLSANGAYLVLAGYDETTGLSTNPTSIASTVALVNGAGTINTSTTTNLLEASGNSTRNATSFDGTSIWTSDQNGVVYETTGTSMGGTLVDSKPNGREMDVVPAADSPTASDALFASTNKGSLGVQDFTPALPTVLRVPPITFSTA